MPGMTGLELSRILRERQPNLRTLFLSGYTADIVTGGALPPDSAFLEKPFDARSLALALRRLLDAPVSPGRRTASRSP
jgi:FixJ family two-component response regulator